MARVEETLGCVAVVAAGVPGHGPWRLVSARYDRVRSSVATLNLGNWMRLVPGAVVMTDADVFAKRLMSEAEAQMRADSQLEAPWFLFAGDDLLSGLKRAALAADVRVMSYEHYVARVEALVVKELS